jgi:hypothetical protein
LREDIATGDEEGDDEERKRKRKRRRDQGRQKGRGRGGGVQRLRGVGYRGWPGALVTGTNMPVTKMVTICIDKI